MPKILKPYTIIPPELYVQRDADKQVKNIITDMGRPGYVLVSRQMGKTNLLLNAKRKLETSSDAFVYIDLSNSFDSAKSCFENIIDIAIDTYPEKFSSIKQLINERRNELKDTPPHKQHTNEIRILLNELNHGKLVIILDEIDALTKTNYSDQIFSQIRSSYFASRINYPEFNNLTYLLSGVVEPSEIIKDPKVSPFNIGQKIYLNDFSRNEFEHFLQISQLSLNLEHRDRIFYWTNGNPRITWDLCSAIENEIKNNKITIENIDSIVNDIYLKSFDKPPIDTIREIVKKDREIRNSIIEIEYKKGHEISDRIKSKLYLAGIINYEEDNIVIKNHIIRRCLNLDWIKSLEVEEKGLINLAMEEYNKLEYSKSLALFEEYLEINKFDDDHNRPHYYYIMGHCAYLLKKYNIAIKYINLAEFDLEDEAIWYFKTLNQKGLTYYYLDEFEKSLDCFKIIIDKGKKDEIFIKALLNYGSLSIKTDKSIYQEKAVSIFNDIINETAFNKDKLKPEFIQELKSISHYNLAQINIFNKNFEFAKNNLAQALTFGTDISKPKIILSLFDITEDVKLKEELIEILINLIESGKIIPKESNPDKPMDFNLDEFKEIVIYCLSDFSESLFHKIKPFLSLLGEKSIAKHIYDLALFSIQIEQNLDVAYKMLNEIYVNVNNIEFEIDDETKYETFKLLAYFSNIRESQDKHFEYLELFAKQRFSEVDQLDMEIFAHLILVLTEKKNYKEALKYATLIESIRDTVPESTLINYLVIYNLELNLYFYLNNRQKSIEKAKEIIELSNNEKIKKQNSNLLGETGLEIIRQNAMQILYPTLQKKEPVKTGKIYGRNDIVKVRYNDGSTIETKFKKIENDLRSEKCFILNNE